MTKGVKISWVSVLLCPILLTLGCADPDGNREVTAYRSLEAPSQYTIDLNRYTNDDLNGEANWSVYSGDSPDQIDTYVADTSEDMLTVSGIAVSDRKYFKAIDDTGVNVTVSETRIPLEGQRNFRDLGGIIAEYGSTRIRWGLIYRSGELSDLTDSDLSYLNDLALKTVVDLRDDEEVTQKPDPQIGGTNYLRAPMEVDDPVPVWIQRALTLSKTELDDMLTQSMAAMPTKYLQEYSKLLHYQADAKNLPLVYHCNAGKDRTGFATILLLSALGVDLHTIRANYLGTNHWLSPQIEARVNLMANLREDGDGEATRSLFSATDEFFEAFMHTVDTQYGGMDNYLVNHLNVDVQALREIYLEPRICPGGCTSFLQ